MCYSQPVLTCQVLKSGTMLSTHRQHYSMSHYPTRVRLLFSSDHQFCFSSWWCQIFSNPMGSAAWPAEIRHMHTARPLLSIPGFERESVSGAVSFEAADGRHCLKSSPQLLLHLCCWTTAQVSLSFMQDWQWFNIKFSCCYLSHNWFTQTFLGMFVTLHVFQHNFAKVILLLYELTTTYAGIKDLIQHK